jgi:hypothetical protein
MGESRFFPLHILQRKLQRKLCEEGESHLSLSIAHSGATEPRLSNLAGTPAWKSDSHATNNESWSGKGIFDV